MPEQLTSVDLAICAIVLVSAVFGLLRGFAKEALSLAIWAAALVLGVLFGPALGEFLADDLGRRPRAAVGFAVVLALALLAGAIVQRLMAGFVEKTGLTGADRALGLAFGLARGVGVVLVALIALNSFATASAWWADSPLATALLAYEDDVLAFAGAVADAIGALVGREAALEPLSTLDAP